MLRLSVILSMLAAACLGVTPADAFVLNGEKPRPGEPLGALKSAARWNANDGSLVSSGERGLGGGLEFSLDEAFCATLKIADDPASFGDRSVCEIVRAMIVEAGQKWGQDNSAIFLVDVTDLVAAEDSNVEAGTDSGTGPGNGDELGGRGAEIDFFARTRAEEPELEGGTTATTGMIVSSRIPQSTTGSTLWENPGVISETDIIFASDECYYILTSQPRDGCIHFGSILMHELGHALGLVHPDEFTEWNIDSDTDPKTPVVIDCRNPIAGLRQSDNYEPGAIMISNIADTEGWERGPTADDFAGRDFLYPDCGEAIEDSPAVTAQSGETAQGEAVPTAEPVASRPRIRLPISAGNYPIESLLANEEGDLVLNLTVRANGQIFDAEIETSSGFTPLDQWAIALAKLTQLPVASTPQDGAMADSLVLADVTWTLPLESAAAYSLSAAEVDDDAAVVRTLPNVDSVSEADGKAEYPPESVGRGEQGVVGLRMLVSDRGQARNIEIQDSSGFSSLDEAAMRLANATRFVPGTIDGRSTEMWQDMAIAFYTLPGTPSQHCYARPVLTDGVWLRMTHFLSATGGQTRPPAYERWVSVRADGSVDTVLLSTRNGWMRVGTPMIERVQGETEFAAPMKDGVSASCWYYRPFLLYTR